MTQIPYIPETAPFTLEQRAWLNGFLAGLFGQFANGQLPAPLPAGSNSSAEPLLILYGSQTGTAEALARRIARESEKRGFSPRVMELNEYERADLARCGKALIISSTWGDGDPPDNAANFWSWLSSDSAPRLEGLEFAVLGLGDRNYSDFCGASKKFDSRLEALGARRISPRGECDVDYEAAASSWLESLWPLLDAAAVKQSTAPGKNGHSHNERSVYGRANPFPARLLKNVLLNKAGSAKEVRHYELSLDGSGLSYEPGDALGVMPVNCPELVDGVIAALKCKGDEVVAVEGSTLPLRDALALYYDITRPSSGLLSALAKAAPGCELAALLAPERAEELKAWLNGRDVLDVLGPAPTAFSWEELIGHLRKLSPRLYSIASSPRAHPGEVHLTVSAVRYECRGRLRKGVASTFLADRLAGDSACVKAYVQASHGFKPPKSGDIPMVMVGPGTGIAPFRAFLEERQVSGATGKNWLFFGDQKRATDFLYEEQLSGWAKSGHLTRLDLAFSRDQAEKIYVQERMLEHRAELWSWLEAGAHFYVCGDASRMARDVDAALHRVVETAGGKSAEGARAYVAQMISAKRYQRDVY